MKVISKSTDTGFALVEMMMGMFVMALVIVGGLIGLSQANQLSEKAKKQSVADFLLRVETEHIRSMDWTEVETLATTVESATSGSKLYSSMLSITDTDLKKAGMDAEIQVADLAPSGSRGKKAFHITLNWVDQRGHDHEESRVIIVAEGGFSAGS